MTSLRRSLSLLCLSLCPALLTPSADAGAIALTTTRVAASLIQPLQCTHAPGDPTRLYIVEKAGRIKVLNLATGVVNPTLFLNIQSIVNSSTLEWGLIGMCFDPDFATNGYFYVHYSELGTGNDIIARYTATTPDAADSASAFRLLRLVQPNGNHRGGWLDYGPDGYLYIAFGDGGGQMDPSNRAQNINLLQGKILRVDPDGPDDIYGTADDDAFPADPDKNYALPPSNPFAGAIPGADEIWAYGLRNPWRCSFDRATGDFWIGDVGQNTREEIDWQPANAPGTFPGQPGYMGGRNYGWRCTEGTFCTGLTGCICNGPTLTPPVHEYTHAVGLSITGGFVYRGCAMPEMQGVYFFGEFQNTKLFSLKLVGGVATEVTDRTLELDPPGAIAINTPASFGEDARGEIYIVDFGGEIFKIVPAVTPPDCNTNMVPDACDIASGTSSDVNMNGVPDECEPRACCFTDGTCQDLKPVACTDGGGMPRAVGVLCASNPCPQPCPGDLDMSGCVGLADIAVVINGWENPYTLADIAAIIQNWAIECVPGACGR